MTNRWYSVAIVAVLSMSQALASSFDRVGSDLKAQVVRRIDQHKDKPIGMGASLVTDKCAQVFKYLKPRWKDYAIVGLFLGFVYQGRQIAQQGRQIARLQSDRNLLVLAVDNIGGVVNNIDGVVNNHATRLSALEVVVPGVEEVVNYNAQVVNAFKEHVNQYYQNNTAALMLIGQAVGALLTLHGLGFYGLPVQPAQ